MGLVKQWVCKWVCKCQKAFLKGISQVTSVRVLTHFNLLLPIKLACDASSYDIRAVILHAMLHGTEWPIVFALHLLIAAD